MTSVSVNEIIESAIEMSRYIEALVCALESFSMRHLDNGRLCNSVLMNIKTHDVDTVVVFAMDDHKMHVMQYYREFEDVYPWTCVNDLEDQDKASMYLEMFQNIEQTTHEGCIPEITLDVNDTVHKLV
jgi:hypothetical protein